MKRILFVDDEPDVLQGLRNVLRKHRDRWDMVFAPGSQAAVDELAKTPFDVVVSDMRMPGMDGAALLSKVKSQHPRTARIMLSGDADVNDLMHAMPMVQQFLSKPCSVESLSAAIDRCVDLQEMLHNEQIRCMVGKIENLPSVPQIYWDLTQTLGDPMKGIPDAAKIINKDPAMCVKLLQIANSAYFGVPKAVTSVAQAIAYLGTDRLKGLVLTTHVFKAFESRRIVSGFSIQDFQKTSLATAHLARQFVDTPKSAESAFTAGMIHDIGKLIIAIGMPSAFETTARIALAEKTPIQEVEKKVLGFSHAEVGAYLLGTWGLPMVITEAVAFHHTPSSAAADQLELVVALHAGSVLASAGSSKDWPFDTLDLPFLERAGATAKLPQWCAKAEDLRRAI